MHDVRRDENQDLGSKMHGTAGLDLQRPVWELGRRVSKTDDMTLLRGSLGRLLSVRYLYSIKLNIGSIIRALWDEGGFFLFFIFLFFIFGIGNWGRNDS